MDELTPSRRRVLASGSGLLAAGLAGCLGEDTDGQDDVDADENGSDEQDDENGADDDHDHDDHSHDDAHDHASDHEPGDPESTLTVKMISDDDGEHFIPHVAHVEAGGTVEWVVESGNHDTVAYHPDTHGDHQRIPDEADPWESDLLSDGDAFERTFDVEGVYDYACTPHEGSGMVGTVIVGWPDPADQPGLEPPSDDRPEAAVEQLERYNETVREVLEGGDGHDEDEGGDHHGDDDHDDHDH